MTQRASGGARTSRRVYLANLSSVLARCPATARQDDFRSVIVVVGDPPFRALLKLWARDLQGRPQITLLMACANHQAHCAASSRILRFIVTVTGPPDGAGELPLPFNRHLEPVEKAGRRSARDNAFARGCTLGRTGARRLKRRSPPLPLLVDRLTQVSAGTKIVLGRATFVAQIPGQPGTG